MIIFFDWADESGQDGLSDHTGIVQKVENGKVYTVEGNSGDSCRVNEYSIGYYEILLRRTCLLKYTSRLHFAGGWITYQKDIVPV